MKGWVKFTTTPDITSYKHSPQGKKSRQTSRADRLLAVFVATRPNEVTNTETSELPPPPKFNLHTRWTMSELTALAKAELACRNEPYMNQTLARTFITRSWQGITGQRNIRRYKGILDALKKAVHSYSQAGHSHNIPPTKE